jgi:hypothetical protein
MDAPEALPAGFELIVGCGMWVVGCGLFGGVGGGWFSCESA